MKNNLTLLAREGKAKSFQNTGGGASQQSTAQHDSARVFKYFNTQMARFLWNKKGEATVSEESCSWAQGRATSAEQPTNHALITHLSPTQTVSLARIWKYVACLLLVLFVGVGNVWGEDFTVTPINGSYLSPGNLVKLSISGDLKISSTQVQTNAKNNSGTITISTTAPGVYLKSASFTDANSGKLNSFTCTSGGTMTESSPFAFTASENVTTATFSLSSNGSGAAKLGSIEIVVTNGSLNDIETLSGFSFSSGTFSFTSKKNGSSVTPSVSLTSQESSSWSASSSNISAPSSNDSKTITITSENDIKYIALYDSNCRLSLVEKSSTGGTVDGASWKAPAVGSVKSVTFKNGISTSLTITKVYVITETSGGDDPGDTPANYEVTHTLTNNVAATSGATGASAATEGSAYNAVFAANKLGYSLPSTIGVTIGGEAATVGTDYTWNSSTGAFQVPAAKVTGNIVVTIAGIAPVKTFKNTYTDFTQVGETNDYYTYLTQANYTSYATAGWMEYDVPKTGEQKLLIDPATDDATTPASKSTYGIVKQVDTRYMEFYLTGITSVKFYFHNSNSSNDRTIKYKLNDGDGTDLVTVNRSTSNSASIALSSSTENTIRIYADEELYVCAMKVTLPDASCSAPTSPTITATPASAAYTEGDNISLTASATGTDGSTTYIWYKGTTWDAASATSSIGSAATFTKNSCVEGDAGTYWCEISNGTGCEVQVSKTITVAAASCTEVAAPAGLSCTGHTSASLTFGWTAAEHASSYDVKLWNNSACTGDPVASENVTTTSKTFTGLTDETTYYCKVQSKGDGETYCTDGGTTDAVSGTTDKLPSYTVTAVTSTGDNTRGTVSAAASSIKAGATTTITAVPVAGYRVTNWAVSGTGATISPSGASNSLTTTLTMGTANATVTVTFEEIPMYIVTLNPNKGTISDATGWTLNEGKYEKTVAEGTELALPAFTRTGYEFITWRAGAVDKTSPITVNAAIELKAIWGTEEEVTIYSWESPSGTAVEEGGTATHYSGDSPVDGNTRVNYKNTANSVDYYTICLNGKADYSTDHIRFALEENLKTGDEIKITGYYNKNSASTSAPLMKDGSGNTILEETTDWPNIYSEGSPEERTYIVPEGINSNALKLTRNDQHASTAGFITKLVITRTEVVEELDPAEKPTITTQPTGGTYAWDATTTQTVVATVSDGGTLSYQWYEKGETDTKVGSNSASYAPTVSGTYYVIVTNTKTGYAKTTTKSNEVLVTINPRPSYKVSYYDGKVKLGEETVYEGESPAHSGDYEERMLADFDGWYNNEDLAEGHKITSVAALVITANTNIYGEWTKTYAQDVDFVAKIGTDGKTFNYATFLSDKGYLLTQGTGNENALDNTNAFDTGLKLKQSTGNKLQFRAAAGKLVKVVMGKVNGMTYSVNGASAKNLNGGTDKDHLGVTYMYNAGEQEITLAETATAYNMLKSITMTDAPVVTYNATTNGGTCASDEAVFQGTAMTLPAATKDGSRFDGWFTTADDETETGTLVGLGGASYTPAASITLYARFTATTSLATLTDIKVNGTTITGFAADKYEYTIVFPYKTAVVPTVAYTRGYEGDGESAGEAVTMSPDPITSVTGDVTLHVVSEDGTVEQDYILHFTEAPKDMLCIISAKHTNATTATVTGYIGGTADKSTSGNSKLGSKGNYFGITLAKGTFQAGDVVMLRTATGADTNGDKVRIFKSNAASAENVLVEGTAAMVYGDNYVTLPATDLATIYIRRGTDEEAYNNGWNPYIDVFAVYRPFPQPLLTGMTIDGAVAVVDELDATVYNVTIPAGSNLASLDVVPTFLSNDPSLTNGAVSGSWAIGSNTYVVTDKDGDSKSYTINITRDVAVESVSVSGETTVAAKSQITLTATVLPAEVSNKAVTWSSSDETKATVNANGVVTGKAEGTVTITATSVADGTKKGTKEITVTKFVGTERAYWFVYAADAEANGVENNSTVFGSAPTGSNNGGFELTLEEGWTVTTTKKTGSTSSFGTFTVPADFTATWYAAVKAGGDNRVLNMKQGDVVKYSVALTNATDPEIVKIENIAAGTYDVVLTGGSSISGAYLFAAELNSYPLTSVALEEGFNLRLEQSRTPVFTITPAKAAVVSQVWSEVSRTGASDATLNTSTGEITAGTEEGTLTVKVTVTDAFGNEAESGNCVVKIVNIIDQKDVTGSMTWNWTGARTASVTIDNEEALVLGNYIDGDQWAYLKGTNGDQAYHHESSYGSYQGKGTLSFKTTVPGLVTITARRWSNTPDLKIGEDVILSLDGSNKTSKAYFVPAGEVNIIADASDGMRILKIEFDANITADKAENSHFGGHIRSVSEGQMTTVCVDHNVPAGCIVGAEVYKLLYWKYGTSYADCQMVDFEQVEEMNAGEPYMVLPTSNTFALFYGAITEASPKHMPNGFIGTYDPIAQADDNILVGKYAIVGTTVLKLGQNCGCSANRAYIDLSETPSKEVYEASLTSSPSSAPKKRVSLGRKSEHVATGMDGINVENEQVQKVMIDGQMYIVRGGHIYNATGILVK